MAAEHGPSPAAPKAGGGKESKFKMEYLFGVALAGLVTMGRELFNRKGVADLIKQASKTLDIFGDMITGGGGGGGHAAPAAAGAHHG